MDKASLPEAINKVLPLDQTDLGEGTLLMEVGVGEELCISPCCFVLVLIASPKAPNSSFFAFLQR